MGYGWKRTGISLNLPMIKKIGLITSGGDAPGMNACIRAIVRTAQNENIDVLAFYCGCENRYF